MAPITSIRARQSVSTKDFSRLFGLQKTVSYHDPQAVRGPNHGIRSIAWTPQGTYVATAQDRILRVWNIDRPNVKYSTELRGHISNIEQIAFNPVKEAQLCSVAADGVKFWDVKTKAIISEVKGLGEILSLAWHPDGSKLLVGNRADKIYVLDPTDPTFKKEHQQSVVTNNITFDHSGDRVFLTTGTGKVNIVSFPDFEPAYLLYDKKTPLTLNGHTSPCLSVELQPTARLLATGGSDSIICLWDTTDWICQRTLIDMVGPIRSVSFSFDGSYIVGGSDEGDGLKIAHAETGEYVHTVKTSGPCSVVAWHPHRYMLAYADMGTLKIIGVEPDKR